MADSSTFKKTIPGARKNLADHFKSGPSFGDRIRKMVGIEDEQPSAAQSPKPSPSPEGRAIEQRKKSFGY